MLRYLIKTLLQMNLFSDTMRNPSNGTDLFYNMSLPSFNSSLLDWGNFSGSNGECFVDINMVMTGQRLHGQLTFGFKSLSTGSKWKKGYLLGLEVKNHTFEAQQ